MLKFNTLNGFYNNYKFPLVYFIAKKTVTIKAPIFSSNVMCCGYMVGAGGGGGTAGGGGAGALYFNDFRLTGGTDYTVVGAPDVGASFSGTASTFAGFSAPGGAGGIYNISSNVAGGQGGSSFVVPGGHTDYGFGRGGNGGNAVISASTLYPGTGGGAGGFGNTTGGRANGGFGDNNVVGGLIAPTAISGITGGGAEAIVASRGMYQSEYGGGGVGGDNIANNNFRYVRKFGLNSGSYGTAPGSASLNGGNFGGGGGGGTLDVIGNQTASGSGAGGFVYLIIFPEIANTDPYTGKKYGFPGGDDFYNDRVSYSNNWTIRVL